jgi:hypothetical protein
MQYTGGISLDSTIELKHRPVCGTQDTLCDTALNLCHAALIVILHHACLRLKH